ncbi:MAG: Verru_Chthon cassette protein D [Prosthecobacter sp.]|nr:Verru_Chthon cassette protein D [Prosthecobacter sp.]
MKTPSHKNRQHGFTIVELIIVVTIISMLLAFGTPYVLSSLQAASLTSSGDLLMQKISQAQQRALTENRPVSLQFYFYDQDGIDACHAVQLVSVDPATNVTVPLENPVYWSDGRAVLASGALSPIFAQIAPADTGEVEFEPFRSREATFFRVRFYPGGSTSLAVPLRQAYVTLIASNRHEEEMTEPPPNYYTVQIDPVAGRVRSYRP